MEPQFRKTLDERSVPGMFLGEDSNSETFLVGNLLENGKLKVLKSRNVKFIEQKFYFDDTQPANEPPNLWQGCEPLLNGNHSTETKLVDNQAETDTPEVRRSNRERKQPDRLGIDNTYNIEECFNALDLPKSPKAAYDNEKWRSAMQEEYDSLLLNGVWEIVPKPDNIEPLSGKWVFALKYNAEGEITRYKARYVARGYAQKHGVDFNETYSPTTKLSTVRILLNFAAQYNVKLFQLDVKTAYLNAPIDEEIYMIQPPCFEKYGDNGNLLYCKLKKSLYGLKQAGRNWYFRFKEFMNKFGFKNSVNDCCLYIRERGG